MLSLGLLSTTLLVRAQTQCVDTNEQKYFQPPNLAGFDVLNEGPWVLGDDFVCTNTGPISNIYLWGSWLNNNVGTITNFWLGIYDDVAANANNPPPESTNSHPGNLLWEESFVPGQFVQTFYSDSQEQFLNPGAVGSIGTDSQAWEYCFYPTNPFTQTGSTTAPKIYWLVAYAQVASVVGSGPQDYGWKTTAIVQNDISVFEPWTGSLPGTNSNWIPTVYQAPTGGQEPLDLAFKLETTPSCIDFTCPNNLVTYMPCGSSCVIITNYPPFFATNVCAPSAGVNVSFNPPPGSCFPLGNTPVTMTVSGSGQTSSCTFLVTVLTNPNCPTNTNNPPCLDIVCPTNLVTYMPCGSSCVPIPSYPPFFATNVCAPAAGVNVSFNPPPGSCFPLGSTPVTMTVSGSGETSNCTFLVTVQTNPNCGTNCLNIVCPTNLMTYMPCGSSCVIITNYPPFFATNVCAPSAGVMVTFNPPPGSCFPLGTTPVTMTVSGSGETTNCTFLVTVQTNPNCNGMTNNPPCLDIVCPTNVVSTMPCGSSCLTITNYPPFFATNYCNPATGGGVTVTFSPPPGSCFPLGTTPVTMTVSGGGETTNCTFLVTVQTNANCPPPVECVESDYQKYVQGPNLIGGYDVWNVPYVLADDFVCTNTGPIADIHLWGSWNDNEAQTNSITFWLGIYNNVPTGVDKPYSHPGTNLLWQQWFSPGQYAETIWTANAAETFMDPGHTNCLGSDSVVWYYCFYPTNAFEQLGTPTNHITYWLAAYATNVVNYGWKTTTNVLNDVSVHANWPGFAPTNNPGWQPTYACASPTNGLDLAFKLTMCSPVDIKFLAPTNVLVSWEGGGYLQSATNVIGPYVDIPGSPLSPFKDYTLSATNKFYRLRCY